MHKILRVVDCSNSPNPIVNWSLCIICQRTIPSDSLVCPADSKKQNAGAGYSTLANDLLGFNAIDCLPSTINLNALDDGSGIQNTLSINCACWHKSCRDSINSTKLGRAQKRKYTHSENSGTSTADIYSEPLSSVPRLTRSLSNAVLQADNVCFFCEEKQGSAPSDKLWQVRTFSVDQRVRRCASELQDVGLLAKLAEGDMIATEAHYHSHCLVSLYNRAERLKSDQSRDIVYQYVSNVPGIVLAELVAYIDDVRSSQIIAPVFKLSELNKMYTCKLQQLGIPCKNRENSTRLKERILSHFPDMIAVSEGRGHDVLLMFDESLGNALAKACLVDRDADGIHLVRAAQIVRREMFNCESPFDGHFSSRCQQKSVPKSLLTLMQLILDGPCIDDIDENNSTAATTVAQLIVFNGVKKCRTTRSRTCQGEH